MSRPPVTPADPPPEPDSGGRAFESDSGTGLAADSGTGPVPSTARPRGIAVIALIVAAEATGLLAAAAWYGYQLISGAPVQSLGGAIFTLALLLAFAAWLYAVAYHLFRGRRWTRAAALVAQLLVLTIGLPALTGGIVWAGVAMVAPAVTALVLLFDKRVINYASRTGDLPVAL